MLTDTKIKSPKEFTHPADTPLPPSQEIGTLANVPSIFKSLSDKMTYEFERTELDDLERDNG
ncbi:hypothetical protein B0181_10060 [Moraxella caviae]|uniref:Uncharacterized protein n=1 Tax=Moraxella caviae TaxID=34060 RepID=A0A1S9ZVV3_9GAMM|nr:hypothetical protein [Moraxella caviae]OOR87652.1 hypothetical protein B0181_10060 [Moraxella caviae]STZ10113.1 Uncharacterised protein [Moraxella caviae]